jgi:hypothetical protein
MFATANADRVSRNTMRLLCRLMTPPAHKIERNNSSRGGLGLSRPACGRNNSIHPQVFHHLPVVLPVVPQREIRHFQSG